MSDMFYMYLFIVFSDMFFMYLFIVFWWFFSSKTIRLVEYIRENSEFSVLNFGIWFLAS